MRASQRPWPLTVKPARLVAVTVGIIGVMASSAVTAQATQVESIRISDVEVITDDSFPPKTAEIRVTIENQLRARVDVDLLLEINTLFGERWTARTSDIAVPRESATVISTTWDDIPWWGGFASVHVTAAGGRDVVEATSGFKFFPSPWMPAAVVLVFAIAFIGVRRRRKAPIPALKRHRAAARARAAAERRQVAIEDVEEEVPPPVPVDASYSTVEIRAVAEVARRDRDYAGLRDFSTELMNRGDIDALPFLLHAARIAPTSEHPRLIEAIASFGPLAVERWPLLAAALPESLRSELKMLERAKS